MNECISASEARTLVLNRPKIDIYDYLNTIFKHIKYISKIYGKYECTILGKYGITDEQCIFIIKALENVGYTVYVDNAGIHNDDIILFRFTINWMEPLVNFI